MSKDNLAMTKLQKTLFYRFKCVHSNAIFIPKLQKMSFVATSFTPCGPIYDQKLF